MEDGWRLAGPAAGWMRWEMQRDGLMRGFLLGRMGILKTVLITAVTHLKWFVLFWAYFNTHTHK